MLTFVTWKWNGDHWKKPTQYTAEHVNVLARMIARNYRGDHELVCITDDPTGIDPGVRIVPLWKDPAGLGRCWRRLRVFTPEMGDILAERFVSIDLDTVIVGDITPLFSGGEAFRIWGEYWRRTPYCASLMMMSAGMRAFVWDEFQQRVDEIRRNNGARLPYGSDQDHISRCLFPWEPMWTMADGVHNFNHTVRRWNRFQLTRKVDSKYHSAEYARMYQDATGRGDWSEVIRHPRFEGNGEIPPGARIIFFNGKYDPSDQVLQKEYPWIKENWR